MIWTLPVYTPNLYTFSLIKHFPCQCSFNVWQVHHRWSRWLLRHRVCLRCPSGTEEGFWRYNTNDCVQQGMVGSNRQEVPGLASHGRSAGRHEPHQPPELHRQGSRALIRFRMQAEHGGGCRYKKLAMI